ncbi:MAG: hypothetical protein PVI23_12470 [Maricaulaceae bacterium]|jgi:TPR repeat protein
MFYRKLALAAVAAASMSLTACVGATVSGATLAAKGSQREGLFPAASAGDPVAQTDLGKSWCCMGPGFDTQRATEWFCEAAHQDFAEAQYELGRIYDGDVSRTMAPGQKLIRMATAQRDTPLSLMWLELAAAQGHEDAADRAEMVRGDMSAEELTESAALAATWRDAPCEFDDVFAS